MKTYLFAALAAVLFGFAPVLEKMGLRKAQPLAALSVRLVAVTVAVLILAFATGAWRDAARMDGKSALFIVLGGLSAALFGHLAYYQALKHGTAASIVPFTATYPLIAAALSMAILREPLTTGKIVGAILVVLGVLALSLDKVIWKQ